MDTFKFEEFLTSWKRVGNWSRYVFAVEKCLTIYVWTLLLCVLRASRDEHCFNGFAFMWWERGNYLYSVSLKYGGMLQIMYIYTNCIIIVYKCDEPY